MNLSKIELSNFTSIKKYQQKNIKILNLVNPKILEVYLNVDISY